VKTSIAILSWIALPAERKRFSAGVRPRRTYGTPYGNDGRFFFWLKEGKSDPDTVHFGFVAKSHTEVNAFFVAAIGAGGREKTAPTAQLQYHPDYCGT
jgi:hypothetical protein